LDHRPPDKTWGVETLMVPQERGRGKDQGGQPLWSAATCRRFGGQGKAMQKAATSRRTPKQKAHGLVPRGLAGFDSGSRLGLVLGPARRLGGAALRGDRKSTR